MVGGATPSRIARIEKIASTAPAAPSRCPMQDLVDDIEILAGGIADHALHRAKLDGVGHGRGAVGVDVVDVVRRDAGALDRRVHAAERAVAVLGRRRDVEGVARQAVADQFGVDLRAARLGVLVLLEHDDAGPLAHHEAVAVLVVGARGLGRRVVEAGRRAPGRPQSPPSKCRLTGDSVPPATITSASPSAISRAGIADGMRAGRAGGDDRVVRPLQAVLDRHIAATRD